jgi:hypothetical protein
MPPCAIVGNVGAAAGDVADTGLEPAEGAGATDGLTALTDWAAGGVPDAVAAGAVAAAGAPPGDVSALSSLTPWVMTFSFLSTNTITISAHRGMCHPFRDGWRAEQRSAEYRK